jgi:tetratricopeptide (TPR) repeat protein
VMAVLHTNRGNMFVDLGRHADAEAEHEKALAIDVATFGERHPNVASDLLNLARDVGRHDVDRARAPLEQARSIREEFLGPESRATGEAVLGLANLALDTGDLADARARGEEALAILAKSLPADHMHFAAVHNHLGIVANRTGRQADALRHYGELERIVRQAHGEEHPHVATALQNRANVLRETGDFAGALALYERALTIKDKVRGPNHPSLAPLLATMARTQVELGRLDEASAAIERSLAIRRATDGDRDDLAWAEYIAARVMFEMPRAPATARAQALQQARRSLATLREIAGSSTPEIVDIEAWLAAHSGG